jgi:hypothetical protein
MTGLPNQRPEAAPTRGFITMHSDKHATPKSTSPSREPSGTDSSARLQAVPSQAVPSHARASRIAGVPIENPHELLGLVAGEENTRVIIEAARSRLARIREANGSEAVVRAFVIGQICRARAAMLKEARRRSGGRDRDGERRLGESAVLPPQTDVCTQTVH